jgi:hypothetical protein
MATPSISSMSLTEDLSETEEHGISDVPDLTARW